MFICCPASAGTLKFTTFISVDVYGNHKLELMDVQKKWFSQDEAKFWSGKDLLVPSFLLQKHRVPQAYEDRLDVAMAIFPETFQIA